MRKTQIWKPGNMLYPVPAVMVSVADREGNTNIITVAWTGTVSFRFGEARKFTMADKFCAVSFLQINAPEMDDRMLTELLDTDSGLLVSLHIRSMDQNEAIKTVKRKITDIDSMKIDAQKKAVREGFDMDIIPTDLATYAGEAKNILRDLQSRNERMFLMTFLVVNFADSKQKLENDLLRAASVAQKYNCSLVRLDFQQEDGFVSALPLGVNRIKIQRGLTTSAVAVFVPFTTQEIFHGGEALYYGLNATSGNMILADRKKLKTPNGMILGTPGSGIANNRIGMFVDISKVFTERQIDITSMNVRTSKQGKATIMMAFDIHGIEELNKLTDKL